MTASNPQYIVIGIFLAYTVLVAVLWKVNEVDYDTIGHSVVNIRKGIIVPIGAGAVLLAVATTVLGAWHDTLFEDVRSGPNWALVVPVLIAIVAIGNTALIDFRSDKANILPPMALGVLLVGFSEEVVTRGLMVAGLRSAGWSALSVYLVSSVLFALLHGINVLFGQSLKTTITQIVMAFVMGTALYITRLTTGTLLTGIVLHALWDFGTLGIGGTGSKQKPVIGAVAIATFVTSMVTIWFVI